MNRKWPKNKKMSQRLLYATQNINFLRLEDPCPNLWLDILWKLETLRFLTLTFITAILNLLYNSHQIRKLSIPLNIFTDSPNGWILSWLWAFCHNLVIVGSQLICKSTGIVFVEKFSVDCLCSSHPNSSTQGYAWFTHFCISWGLIWKEKVKAWV